MLFHVVGLRELALAFDFAFGYAWRVFASTWNIFHANKECQEQNGAGRNGLSEGGDLGYCGRTSPHPAPRAGKQGLTEKPTSLLKDRCQDDHYDRCCGALRRGRTARLSAVSHCADRQYRDQN